MVPLRRMARSSSSGSPIGEPVPSHIEGGSRGRRPAGGMCARRPHVAVLTQNRGGKESSRAGFLLLGGLDEVGCATVHMKEIPIKRKVCACVSNPRFSTQGSRGVWSGWTTHNSQCLWAVRPLCTNGSTFYGRPRSTAPLYLLPGTARRAATCSCDDTRPKGSCCPASL